MAVAAGSGQPSLARTLVQPVLQLRPEHGSSKTNGLVAGPAIPAIETDFDFATVRRLQAAVQADNRAAPGPSQPYGSCKSPAQHRSAVKQEIGSGLPPPQKRARLQDEPLAESKPDRSDLLFSVPCLWRVDPIDGHSDKPTICDGGLGRVFLAVHHGSTDTAVPSDFYVSGSSVVVGCGVCHGASSATIIARLPVLDTASESFPVEGCPWRLGCGEWLLAAARLHERSLLRIEAQASVEHGGTVFSLAIDVYAGPGLSFVDQTHRTSKSKGRVAMSQQDHSDMAVVMRFASQSWTFEAERQRRGRLDASAIYAHLRGSRTEDQSEIQPIDMHSILLPFQRRSTAFLLGREGKELVNGDCVDLIGQSMTSQGLSQTGLWWEMVHEGLWFNCLTCQFARSLCATFGDEVRGALLAEEMGLGKTVEILVLIMRHKASAEWTSRLPWHDQDNDIEVQPVKATLIVAPDVLCPQWADEIARHAPTLHLYNFSGRTACAKDVPTTSTWQAFAKDFDVILVSFGALQRELAAAHREPVRSRRAPRKYERPRSPLIQLEYHRVVCDEIQMVGNSTKAAEVVSMIPRASSIAASGTPVKRLQDLGSFFKFLRLPKDAHLLYSRPDPVMAPHLFRALNVLTTRHLKSDVRAEMRLPQQTRFVVPIDFTAVENAYYEQVWTASLQALELDSTGSPLHDQWELDTVKMRNHLLLLRQACTHPQVAGRSIGSGTMAHGNLRSLSEVLIFMKEQVAADHNKAHSVWASRSIDRILHRLRSNDRGALQLAEAALEDLLQVLQASRGRFDREISAARKIGPGYQFSDTEISTEGELSCAELRQRDGRQYVQSARTDARAGHLTTLANRQRHCMEHYARAAHWLGNVRFRLGEQLTTQDSSDHAQNAVDPETERERLKKAEDQAYDLAEATRKELLEETRLAVERITLTTRKHMVAFDQNALAESADLFARGGGIKSYSVFAQVKARMDLLAAQGETLFKWRREVIALLFSAVNREVSIDNVDDDQYAETLEAQGKAEVILDTYRPLLACRQQILTPDIAIGATDIPIAMRDLESVITIAKQKRRRAALQGSIDVTEAPTDELHPLSELDRERLTHYRSLVHDMQMVSLGSLEDGSDSTSLQDLFVRLRTIVNDDETSAREVALAQAGANDLRGLLKRQGALMETMRRELDALSRLFNTRAEYFKQLQALSDDLVDLQAPSGSIEIKLAEISNEVDAAMVRMKSQEARLRYLEHLEKMEQSGLDDEARSCIICTNEIQIGTLISACGHIVCQKCFQSWHSSHRTCPICRQKIDGPESIHRIVYSRPSAESDEKTTAEQSGNASKLNTSVVSPANFSFMNGKLQRSIEGTSSLGRYGSKLDMLVRHLIYISQTASADKSIVFSAFPRGLELVADALRQNGLVFVSVATGGGKSVAENIRRFTHGPTNILLLHSEQTSAGLNLVATKNIILLEPLVNSGAERQALGRIHRIGQTKETNVFCYYVKETVEERILLLAASRGQSLYLHSTSKTAHPTEGETDDKGHSGQWSGSDGDSGRVIADTTSSSKEKGDYVNSTNDLLSCFFAEHASAHVDALPTGLAPASGRHARDAPSGQIAAGGDEPSANGTTSMPSLPSTDAERAREARLEVYRRRELAEARFQP